MGVAAIWALALLAAFGVATWRVDRYMHACLRARNVAAGLDEATQREKLVAVQLAEATVDEAAELKRAELRRQTAEVEAATALIEDLKPDRLEAERRVIAANADANVELAEEFAQAEHGAELAARKAGNSSGDTVEKYDRYIAAARSRGGQLDFLDLEDFLRVMKEHGQL